MGHAGLRRAARHASAGDRFLVEREDEVLDPPSQPCRRWWKRPRRPRRIRPRFRLRVGSSCPTGTASCAKAGRLAASPPSTTRAWRNGGQHALELAVRRPEGLWRRRALSQHAVFAAGGLERQDDYAEHGWAAAGSAGPRSICTSTARGSTRSSILGLKVDVTGKLRKAGNVVCIKLTGRPTGGDYPLSGLLGCAVWLQPEITLSPSVSLLGKWQAVAGDWSTTRTVSIAGAPLRLTADWLPEEGHNAGHGKSPGARHRDSRRLEGAKRLSAPRDAANARARPPPATGLTGGMVILNGKATTSGPAPQHPARRDAQPDAGHQVRAEEPDRALDARHVATAAWRKTTSSSTTW